MKKQNIDDLVQGGNRVLQNAACVISAIIFLGLLLFSYLTSLIIPFIK